MNQSSKVLLHTGNQMPALGLGTWQNCKDIFKIVKKALELGYGTRSGIGKAIKSSGLKREDYYIVTKVEKTDDAYQATTSHLKELDLGLCGSSTDSPSTKR